MATSLGWPIPVLVVHPLGTRTLRAASRTQPASPGATLTRWVSGLRRRTATAEDLSKAAITALLLGATASALAPKNPAPRSRGARPHPLASPRRPVNIRHAFWAARCGAKT